MFKRTFGAAFVCLGLVLAPGREAYGAEPLPVEAFTKRPEIRQVVISPSGRYLAISVEKGDLHLVMIRDLQTKKDTVGLSSKEARIHIDSVAWKTDDRLVAEISKAASTSDPEFYGGIDPNIKNYISQLVNARAALAFDRDGSHQTPFLGVGLQDHAPRFGLVDALKIDPDHVLTEDQGVLYRTEIHTGASVEIDYGGNHVVGWYVNSRGEPVVRIEDHGGIAIEVRKPGAADWKELTRISRQGDRLFADLELLGPAEDPTKFYVATMPKTAEEGQMRNVHLLDLATRAIGPPLWPELKYDLSSIVRGRDTDAMVGVCYYADILTCEGNDEAYNRDRKALNTFFESGRDIEEVSRSTDNKLWVLWVTGPDEPGTYYLFDRASKKVEVVGAALPELAPDRLGEAKPYVYKARDGEAIPAYLTRPPNTPVAGKLPLIVMPHGGPEARDTLGYDRLAQLLATRGYLVLQPNYRGSAGYGLSFRDAGRKQWGRRMQQDIEDGARALIASGQADASRVCIFGASYGGYAALIGGALTPDLYKCVISFAGVSDLGKMLEYEAPSRITYDYWTQVIGDPKADREIISQGSPVRYASTYRPPVLLIHGEVDDTVPIEQSEFMEDALKRAGKSVKFVRVPGGHGDQNEENWNLIMKEVIDFLKVHITG